MIEETTEYHDDYPSPEGADFTTWTAAQLSQYWYDNSSTQGRAFAAHRELFRRARLHDDSRALIAAAPELYEACKLAEDTFATYGEMYGFTEIAPAMWEAIGELQAALAKAEGD